MAPETTTPAQVLDLTTEVPDRERIKIDGEAYELATMGDLTLGDQLRVARSLPLFQRISDPAEVANLTDDEIERIDADVRWVVRKLVIGATDDVLGRLTDDQMLQIIACFKGAGPSQRTTAPQRKRSRAS